MFLFAISGHTHTVVNPNHNILTSYLTNDIAPKERKAHYGNVEFVEVGVVSKVMRESATPLDSSYGRRLRLSVIYTGS